MERFWSRVEKGGEEECWPFQGPVDKDGYGWCMAAGERKAHRVAWVLTRSPIPEKTSVLHSCDNPGCCNPAHLCLGTHEDNMRDRAERDRSKLCGAKGEKNGMRKHPGLSRGSRNGLAKLTEADVLRIREKRAEGGTVYELAEEFKLSHPTVSNICTRKTWKHVGGPTLTPEVARAIYSRGGKKARETAPTKPNAGSFRKGDGRAGEAWNAKLTEADVRAIREASGKVRQVELAQRYGVSQAAISAIIARRTWAEVE